MTLFWSIWLSLRENLSLPCKQVARQRALFARQSPHGNVWPGNAVVAVSLAKTARQRHCHASLRLPWAKALCRASLPMLWANALCRAPSLCRAPWPSAMHPLITVCRASAVEHSLSCAAHPPAWQCPNLYHAPPVHPQGKTTARHITRHQGAQASAT
jgi:hypothetical protein